MFNKLVKNKRLTKSLIKATEYGTKMYGSRVWNSEEISNMTAIYLNQIWAAIDYDNKFHIWIGKNPIPPWARHGQKRNTAFLGTWRNRVFERDDYTCRSCEKRGGELNAHHIKFYKDYPKLRFKVDNGLTLCLKCHKELHKNIKKENKAISNV